MNRYLISVSCLSIFLVLCCYILKSHTRIVYNESMEPSLFPNDYVIFYRNRDMKIRLNSIVIIKDSIKGEIIKRIIGIPGDFFFNKMGAFCLVKKDSISQMKDIEISINNIIIDNKYFVIGDNYSISSDSRKFGLIDRSDIVGVVFLIIHR